MSRALVFCIDSGGTGIVWKRRCWWWIYFGNWSIGDVDLDTGSFEWRRRLILGSGSGICGLVLGYFR